MLLDINDFNSKLFLPLIGFNKFVRKYLLLFDDFNVMKFKGFLSRLSIVLDYEEYIIVVHRD